MAIPTTMLVLRGLCERSRKRRFTTSTYLNLEDARKRIGRFIEEVYNRKRLHSALRYLTPEEFEQHSQALAK